MRSLQTSLSARLLADGLVGGQVIPLPGERLPFAATGTSVRKRAPYGYAPPTTNHIEPKTITPACQSTRCSTHLGQ